MSLPTLPRCLATELCSALLATSGKTTWGTPGVFTGGSLVELRRHPHPGVLAWPQLAAPALCCSWT